MGKKEGKTVTFKGMGMGVRSRVLVVGGGDGGGEPSYTSKFPFCKSWKNSFAVAFASSFRLLVQRKII